MVKVKANTSKTKHKGIQSIADHIGDNFGRVRIGIGRSGYQTPIEHVLSPFTSHESRGLCVVTKTVMEVIECFISRGIHVAMQRYNSKSS